MSNKMHIINCGINIIKARLRIFRGKNPAIISITSFGEFLSKLWVKYFEKIACFFVRQEEHKSHESGIAKQKAQDDTPEERVGSLYHSVWGM